MFHSCYFPDSFLYTYIKNVAGLAPFPSLCSPVAVAGRGVAAVALAAGQWQCQAGCQRARDLTKWSRGCHGNLRLQRVDVHNWPVVHSWVR